MLVGEAPGAQEDNSGIPFVGAAGQLLDKMLRECGINRDACYVTNVVKCRPPENVKPSTSEVKTCMDAYLTKEVAAVAPEFILALGATAMEGIIGRKGITKHRGKAWEIGDATIMATFHPAAVLRNPKYGEALRADLMRFGQLTRGLDIKPTTKVKVIKSKGQLNWLRKELIAARIGGKAISYDIETNGLREWARDAKIVSIAFTVEEGLSYFIPLHHVKTPWGDPQQVLEFLRPALEWEAGPRNVAHNGKFDARWMRHFGFKMPQTFDTMLAGHMVDENRPKSLKYLSQVLLAAPDYDIGEEVKDAYNLPLPRLATYNGKDTDYTHRLYHRFREDLLEEPRVARVFKYLMMPAADMLLDVERRGIMVDWDRWVERMAIAVAKRDKIEKAMRSILPPVLPDDCPTAVTREDFNFNSTQQVGWLLFKHLDLPILEVTDKGAPSSRESVLLRLRSKHKLPAAILAYRKWEKQITGFLQPWAEQLDEELRLHPSYKLFGTVTGRLSSAEPNLQQVPRDTFIRGILRAKPGHKLVQADFSQIELRIAAMMANEKRMLRAFYTNEDLHLKTAAETTGMRPEDVDKETRKKAKAVNFGFLYSMGAKKFVTYARDNYQVIVSEEEAITTRDRFFESYPALRPWHERQKRLARRYHRVSSPLGRVRHLPDILSKDKDVRAEAERQAINSPVQSTASDLMLASLLLLDKHDIPIVGTIHDSGLFEIPEDDLDRALPLIRQVMEHDCLEFVKKHFDADITVPIKVDIEVGTHWGEGDEWNG